MENPTPKEVYEWVRGNNDGIDRNPFNHPVEGSSWFLLPSSFLNNWKAACGIESGECDADLAIDNSQFLHDSEDVLALRCEIVLKPGLVLGRDYELVPPKAWEYFKANYAVVDDLEIERKSVQLNDTDTEVEVTLKPLRLLMISDGKLLEQSPRTIFVSHRASVGMVRDKVLSTLLERNKSVHKEDLKLFKLHYSFTLDDIKDKFPMKTETPLPVVELKPDKSLEESQVADKHIIIVESKSRFEGWKVASAQVLNADQCEQCKRTASFGVQCMCKKFFYCSIGCRDAHKGAHHCVLSSIVQPQTVSPSKANSSVSGSASATTAGSSAAAGSSPTPTATPSAVSTPGSSAPPTGRSSTTSTSEVAPTNPSPAVPKTSAASKIVSTTNGPSASRAMSSWSAASKRGRAGLQNLGNTCFMNSGLQCLSHTKFLTEFLLSGDYLADINERNPLGTGGKLVREYTSLLKDLWHGTSNSVSPWRFKSTLSQFARQFSGYQQHDSQEMLSFLLDGIHEDLNRVKNKPYVEDKELSDLSEDEQARQFWENHLMRNQSVMVDNFHGQYRSEVNCPNCGHTSLKFDPFLMVTLQIPGHDDTQVSLMFIPLAGVARRLSVSISKTATIKAIREAVMVSTGAANLLIASVSANTTLEKVYADADPYMKYRSLYAYEVRPLEPDETMVALQIYKQYSLSYSMSKSALGYPRLLFVKKSVAMHELYSQIFTAFREVFDEEASFETAFPEFHKTAGANSFKLRLVNPHKSSYYSPVASQCPFCDKRQCGNCDVPYTAETVDAYETKARSMLKLEVIFSNKLDGRRLSQLNETEADMARSATDKRVSIYDCLDCSSRREQLDEHNQSYCRNCKEHVCGYKKMDLYRVNRWLIFHIKRFKHEGYFTSRNNRLVEFPLRGLDMAPYSLTPAGVYDLYAVSNHYGGLGGGHYTAYALNNGEWFEFDDSRASRVAHEARIVSESAYVLFYQLRE